MLVELAITVGIHVLGHATDLVEFSRAVDILHVGSHLGHVHIAITIEHRHRRLLYLRFTQHQLQRVALR